MKFKIAGAALILSGLASAGFAQSVAQPPAVERVTAPTTVEYYYRIKWGALPEFLDLYKRNHLRMLLDVQKQGLITSIVIEEPFTHLAGGVRWDLRVTITYPTADDALAGAAMLKSFGESWGRHYKEKDGEKFMADENKRFELVEDHWDVIVKPVQ